MIKNWECWLCDTPGVYEVVLVSKNGDILSRAGCSEHHLEIARTLRRATEAVDVYANAIREE